MSDEADTGALTVAIADADPTCRRAFLSLARSDARMRVVGEATQGCEALALVERERPRVLLMGTAMPELDGLTALRLLRARAAAIPVVVIADARDAESLLDALSLGACGYVCLDDPRLRMPYGLHARLGELLTDASDSVTAINGAPEGLRASLVARPWGFAGGIGRLLRTERDALGDAVHLLLDAPEWLVEPLARRLHRSTPWRVLAAREGDVLARGHVLVSTLASTLAPSASGAHMRLVRGRPWTSLAHAVEALTMGADVSGPGAVAPILKWAS